MKENTTSTARQIIRIFPLLMRNMRAELRSADEWISPSQFRFMSMISEKDFSMSELATKQAVTKASMSNSVTSLVERGWVQRIPDPLDRRSIKVELTPAGLQLLLEIDRHLELRVSQMIEKLEPGQQACLGDGLEVLEKLLQNALPSKEPNTTGSDPAKSRLAGDCK